VLRLPVQPSRGNFYEASAAKALSHAARIDVTYFERHMSDFADDDVLLNTGVSFPIAFSSAEVRGTEVTFDVPHWKRLSASASYGWQRGTGRLPITGGLFLGDEATSLLTSTTEFPITQDQRQTIRGRAAWQAAEALWTAVAASYGSGLPVEFDGTRADALAQYGQRIVDRVDFDNGRVRPSLSLDAAVGVVIAKSGARRLTVQADVRNLTDRLNVINFAGLFSGTAIATPRSVAVRLRADW
ncbi:MAG TPA: TonB-dependent receptor, partial [Vicinamibacterales bacterium]|nr:TonB-dependent receptor [Vicinamibacterales bacterium]